MKTKTIKLSFKISLAAIILALCISCVSVIGFSAKAAEPNTNTAKITLLAADNTRCKNTDVLIGGKTYVTDENGQFTTDSLPYGKYEIKPTVMVNGVPLAVSMFSQKLTIDRLSNMESMSFRNNFYVYKRFRLDIRVIDTNNVPIRDMKMSVKKGGNVVMSATVTTCLYGTLSFDWMEMPGSASGNDSITFGDTLEVFAEYKGSTPNKFLPTSQTIVLDSSNEYVKLVAYKPGEDIINVEPKLYQAKKYFTTDKEDATHAVVNNAVRLIYDYGMKLNDKDTGGVQVALDENMYKLFDSSGAEIDVLDAYLRQNTVTLEYSKTADATTVSYTPNSNGYLVCEANSKVAVAALDKASVEFSKVNSALYQEYENEVMKLVNEERVRAGLWELRQDDTLVDMARMRSQDMSVNSYLLHESINYGYFPEQIKYYNNYQYDIYKENIATIPLSKNNGVDDAILTAKEAAASVFTSWKNSPGHYVNIMARDVFSMGVGFNESGMWTQLFAREKADKDKIVAINVDRNGFNGKVSIKYNGLIGTQATLSAEPYETFAFDNWTLDGKVVSANANYAFELSAEHKDKTFVANFKKAGYTYKANIQTYKDKKIISQAGGEVFCNGSAFTEGTFTYGAKIVLTAKATQQYTFKGWYLDNGTLPPSLIGVSPNNSKMDLNLVSGENATWIAVFEYMTKATVKVVLDPKYDCTLQEIGANGAISNKMLTEDGYVMYVKDFEDIEETGFNLHLKEYDWDNYTFMYWQNIDTKEILEGDSYGSLLYITSMNLSVEPIFKIKQFTISAAGGNGVILGLGTFDKGSNVTVTAVPNKGYAFKNWSDEVGNTNPTRTIENLDKSWINTNKLVAVYEKIATSMITVSQNNTTAGTVGGGGEYADGGIVTLTASIKGLEYNFLGWYDGETKVSDSQVYRFVANGDKSFEARYDKIVKKNDFSITNNSAQGEVVVKNGATVTTSTSFDYGTTLTLQASAAPNFEFLGFYENNRELTIQPIYTFTILKDTNIVVKYRDITKNIVIFTDMDGKVLSTQEVIEGESAIIPTNLNKVGYTFKGFDIDASKLTNITENMIVKVIYSRDVSYNISVENGEILNAKAEYSFDDKLSLKAAAPQTGRVFSHWTKNGELISYKNQLDIIVDGDAIFKANYKNIGDSSVQNQIVELGRKVFENGKISFIARVELTNGYTMVECGMILVESTNTATTINHNTTGAIIVKSYAQSTTGQFCVSKSNTTSIADYKAVAYITYTDASGNIYTQYSSAL